MGEGTKQWRNVNRRGVVGAAALAAVVVGIFAVTGLGSAFSNLVSHNAAGDPSYKCGKLDTSLTLAVSGPPGSDHAKKVLTISWLVVNDEDSGFAGYWALDTYTVSLGVWSVGAGTYKGGYYFEVNYKGIFQVPQGAKSPGETGTTPNAVTELAAGYGTLAGGEWGYITSAETFEPSTPLAGSLGTYNYGGTTSDLLLGTYGNGQVGDASEFNWYTAEFSPADPSNANFAFGDGGNAWGFVYTLNPLFTAPSGSINEWCNFGAGDAGDIVTAA